MGHAALSMTASARAESERKRLGALDPLAPKETILEIRDCAGARGQLRPIREWIAVACDAGKAEWGTVRCASAPGGDLGRSRAPVTSPPRTTFP
jgi:hypothetical protein